MAKKPASLHIKRVAFGRHQAGLRVKYLLAPRPDAGPIGIPEEVVLYRWRRRRVAGYRFQGARLMPSVWRAMADALGDDIRSWPALDAATIDARIRHWRAKFVRRRAAHRDAGGDRETFEHLNLPSSATVHALIGACGPKRLRALVDRHQSFRDSRRSGVPDLFLYAVAANGKICAPRFVEVKKPEEPVSKAQEDEIAFLLALGLDAQVFRLREPG